MDDVTASEVRKWAWDQYEDARGKEDGKPITYHNRIFCADVLAAWVMSGNLPATHDESPAPFTDQ